VGQKLGLATLAMVTLPIVTYFVALSVFQHKSHPDNWAGGAAVLMTNIIVASYCYSAYVEDLDDDTKRDNDRSGPRVGAFKQRVE
jgi:hypothetical protein